MEASLGEDLKRLLRVVDGKDELSLFLGQNPNNYSAFLDVLHVYEAPSRRTVFKELEILDVVFVLVNHFEELQAIFLVEFHHTYLEVALAGIQVGFILVMLMEVQVVVHFRLHPDIHYFPE